MVLFSVSGNGKSPVRFLVQAVKPGRYQRFDINRIPAPEIIQDNADLLELEHKYDNLQLTLSERRVVNDYIACILSRQERMELLIYYAGRNDAEK